MPSTDIRTIQRLIWLYFWFWIFEGALRKWIFPQLSAPLLIIRDPVVIGAYFIALRAGLFRKDIFTRSIVYIAFILFLGGLATVMTSDSNLNLTATFFGLRSNFLHLPLIFLIPKVFSLDDVKKLGRWVLLLAVPMAILMICQFYSPPSAFINAGTSAETKQLTSALGKIRASGTFSFVTGAAQYLSLVASFLLYGLVQSKIYPNWLLSAASLSLVLALAVSGSRLAIFSVVLVLISLLAVLLIKPSMARKLYKFLLIAAIIGLSLPFVPAFNEGIDVLNARLADTNAVAQSNDGGIVARTLNGFLQPFNELDQIPLLGYGLGIGTNVGSAVSTGKVQYLLAEGEWARVMLESGPVLGLLYILLRIAIVSWMGWLCIKSAAAGNILPLLLFGACGLVLLNGQFSRSSDIGFAVLVSGLCLASAKSMFNTSKQLNEDFTGRQLLT